MRPLSFFLPLAIAVSLAAASGARADYIDDSRTAKGVSLAMPRTSLGEVLREISGATGVKVTAAPGLTEEQLVGYVPRRPLRETMRALEELYDGVWTVLPGSPSSYRLDPDPARAKTLAAARAVALKEYRKSADAPAAEAAARIKKGEPLPTSQQLQWDLLGPLLWSHLSSADRDRVLQGQTVTIAIPQAEAGAIHDHIGATATKSRAPLAAPVMATFDMDDKVDTGIPSIRARATAVRENSVVGAISGIEIIKPQAGGKTTEAPPNDPVLPEAVGETGRFNGERDEVMVTLAEACGLPILSRHRVQGGSSRTVVAGGRRMTDVMNDLALAVDATYQPNSRGYHLFRSRTEMIDRAGLPPAAVLQHYLATRPAAGEVVPFAKLAELAPLTPLQLAVLQRSNLASAEAEKARETFAVMRFYQSLTPEQRSLLFTESGLSAEKLTHTQVHAFLDEKRKRAEFDIHDQLQQMRGLAFRFREEPEKDEDGLILEAVRDGNIVVASTQALPRTEKEDRLVVTP
ncbi:MAG: hypothetical protein ACO1SX_01345 [Actinomycetota bacterium]